MDSKNNFVKKSSTPVDYKSTQRSQRTRFIPRFSARTKVIGRAVRTRATRGVNRVSRVFGISNKAATILSVATLAMGVGTVGTAFLMPVEDEMTMFWVDDDECEDFIQEAVKETGAGEHQIPEQYGMDYSVTISSIENGEPTVWLSGVNPKRWVDSCKTVFEEWRDTGEKDDGGIITINGYYLIACTDKYGNVGDQIDFFLSDGTKIPCLMADTKNQSDDGCNEWGHNNGRCVIEWQVTKKFFDSHPGDWADGLAEHPDWRGKRVASWTNNGNQIGGTGVLGGASSALSSTQQARGKKGIDECQAKGNFDNSTIAAAAVSYSYSQRKEFGNDEYPGTKLYDEVWKATINDEYYRSCDRGVAAAVKWSGADNGFDYGGCENEHIYLSQSSLWEKVDSHNFSGSAADNAAWANEHLEPGDVLCTEANEHTFMYVGPDAVDQGYAQIISGTDGDVGTPDSDAVFVSASIGANGSKSTRHSGPSAGRAPCIQPVGGDGRDYDAFRYVGDYSDQDLYADVGTMATLTATKKGGTKCDCVKEEKKLTCGEEMAQHALELSASAVGTDYLTTAMCEADGVYIEDPQGYDDLVNVNREFDSNGKLVGKGNLHILDSGSLQIICAHPSEWDGSPATDITHARIYGLAQTQKFIDWQDEVCIPGNYQNQNWFCCCSPWVAGVLREFEFDENFPIAAANQTDYALANPDKYQVIVADPTKSIDEQCQPGDILNDPTVHTAMYVGNELASKMYPGCTGNVCEAGQFSHRWLSCTKWENLGSGYSIIRYRCPDGSSDIGRINDGPISASQEKIIKAAKSVGSPGGGLCAAWISMIYNFAFGSYPGGNANDMYNWWCTSNNKSDLKPGMIVAVSTHNLTSNGARWGHVGIYIGNGQVMDNVGYIRTVSLSEWIKTYQTSVPVKWGWVNGKVLN